MNEYVIKSAAVDGQNWVIHYDAPDGTEWAHSFPVGNLETLVAEYGLSDTTEALDVLLHDPHMWAWLASIDHRDDPATAEGWVTTDQPDAEPVTLFTARSTVDARGAHRARISAVKETGTAVVTDPAGLLAPILAAPVNAERISEHAQQVDIHRWTLVYGGLPVAQAEPVPAEQEV